MRQISSNLVAHALGWHDSNLIDNTLVDVEVEGETVVVLLNDLARSALDGLVRTRPICENENEHNNGW